VILNVSEARLSHVQKFQGYNSTRISSIFSAASIMIAKNREKNESLYSGMLDFRIRNIFVHPK
jgi:hypothetical protein